MENRKPLCRIDFSKWLGWVVVVGVRVRYFSADYDDCIRWANSHGLEVAPNKERTIT